jgi:hypothetical protein
VTDTSTVADHWGRAELYDTITTEVGDDRVRRASDEEVCASSGGCHRGCLSADGGRDGRHTGSQLRAM